MDFSIRVVKTKAPISFAVTAKLICVLVFAYAKAGFLTTRLIYRSINRPSDLRRLSVPAPGLFVFVIYIRTS